MLQIFYISTSVLVVSLKWKDLIKNGIDDKTLIIKVQVLYLD